MKNLLLALAALLASHVHAHGNCHAEDRIDTDACADHKAVHELLAVKDALLKAAARQNPNRLYLYGDDYLDVQLEGDDWVVLKGQATPSLPNDIGDHYWVEYQGFHQYFRLMVFQLDALSSWTVAYRSGRDVSIMPRYETHIVFSHFRNSNHPSVTPEGVWLDPTDEYYESVTTRDDDITTAAHAQLLLDGLRQALQTGHFDCSALSRDSETALVVQFNPTRSQLVETTGQCSWVSH